MTEETTRQCILEKKKAYILEITQEMHLKIQELDTDLTYIAQHLNELTEEK